MKMSLKVFAVVVAILFLLLTCKKGGTCYTLIHMTNGQVLRVDWAYPENGSLRVRDGESYYYLSENQYVKVQDFIEGEEWLIPRFWE